MGERLSNQWFDHRRWFLVNLVKNPQNWGDMAFLPYELLVILIVAFLNK